MDIKIEKILEEDKKEVLEIVKLLWGDEIIVAHGEVFHPSNLSGLLAKDGNQLLGILHFQIRGKECEILTLASLKKNQGVGSALLAEIERIAKCNGCCLLTLVTTNDNLNALGFYQKRGFYITALFPNQITQSRQYKSSIPEIGDHGIPIRDELRLEKSLI
jgi:ribosomal protein S18 acetylase RimI-like enzyme